MPLLALRFCMHKSWSFFCAIFGTHTPPSIPISLHGMAWHDMNTCNIFEFDRYPQKKGYFGSKLQNDKMNNDSTSLLARSCFHPSIATFLSSCDKMKAKFAPGPKFPNSDHWDRICKVKTYVNFLQRRMWVTHLVWVVAVDEVVWCSPDMLSRKAELWTEAKSVWQKWETAYLIIVMIADML